MSTSLRTSSSNNQQVIARPSRVLFITECSEWGKLGFDTVASAFDSVEPIFWSPGMPKPDLSNWRGDWIISFKADLILSKETISYAEKGAINFHPSSPKYRGLGGYWWALHNGDSHYGVTLHHMDEEIDHGQIIKTVSFPIWAADTVESLKQRAAIHSLTLLNETLSDILAGKKLAPCGTEWEPHLYTNKQLAAAQTGLAVNGNTAANNAAQTLRLLEETQAELVRMPEETGRAGATDHGTHSGLSLR